MPKKQILSPLRKMVARKPTVLREDDLDHLGIKDPEPKKPYAYTITSSMRGYKCHTIKGSFVGSMTAENVRKEFYHEFFGGSEAWVRGNEFGCIVYDD